MSLYSLIMTVGMLPASVILPALCTRFGEKKMMCITLAASMLAGLIRIVMTMNIPLYYVSGLLSGITMGGVRTVTMIIGVNLVDFVEYEQNVRVDATVSSLNSFSSKVSSAIGTAIPGYILAWTGFSETEAVQSASALMGIKCNFNWVPLILSAVGFLMFLFLYPMGKSKMEEIRKELQTRRTSEAAVTEK